MKCECGHPQSYHVMGFCKGNKPRCWCSKYKEEADARTDSSDTGRGNRGADPAPAVVGSALGASVYESMFPTMYGGKR